MADDNDEPNCGPTKETPYCVLNATAKSISRGVQRSWVESEAAAAEIATKIIAGNRDNPDIKLVIVKAVSVVEPVVQIPTKITRLE